MLAYRARLSSPSGSTNRAIRGRFRDTIEIDDDTRMMEIPFPRRALYIDGVDRRIAEPDWRKRVLGGLRDMGFGEAWLYGATRLLRERRGSELSNFIGELRDGGVERVGAAYGSVSGVDGVRRFQKSDAHSDDRTRFDGAISEIEPWNSRRDHAWAEYFAALDAARRLRDLGGGRADGQFESGAYLGWLHKPDEASTQARADGVIQSVDVIWLHCYAPQPNARYLTSRLEVLGQQARASGFCAERPLRVFPILSAEPEFSGRWLADHGLTASYERLDSELAALRFEGREALDLRGGVLVFCRTALLESGATASPAG